jgi:hypothetical protein
MDVRVSESDLSLLKKTRADESSFLVLDIRVRI